MQKLHVLIVILLLNIENRTTAKKYLKQVLIHDG